MDKTASTHPADQAGSSIQALIDHNLQQLKDSALRPPAKYASSTVNQTPETRKLLSEAPHPGCVGSACKNPFCNVRVIDETSTSAITPQTQGQPNRTGSDEASTISDNDSDNDDVYVCPELAQAFNVAGVIKTTIKPLDMAAPAQSTSSGKMEASSSDTLLDKCIFYYKSQSKEEAHQLLKGHPTGIFLLRSNDNGETSSPYRLSMMGTDKQPFSVRIGIENGLYYFDTDKHLRHDQKLTANDVVTLIQLGASKAYNHGLLDIPDAGHNISCKPLNKTDDQIYNESLARLNSCGFYYGSLSMQEARRWLRSSPPGTYILRDSSQKSAGYPFSLSVKTTRGTTSIRIQLSQGLFRLDSETDKSSQMTSANCVLKLVELEKKKNCTVFLESNGRRDTPVYLKEALRIPPRRETQMTTLL